MIKFVKPVLASIFLAVGFAQAADIIGEYCADTEDPNISETKKLLGPANQIGTKELKAAIAEAASGKECFIFQANNKVTWVAERFKIKAEFSGIYRLKDNGSLFVLPGYAMKGNFDSLYIHIGQDGVNQLMAFNKKYETKMMDMAALATCSKTSNKTQEEFNSCVKSQSQQVANPQILSEQDVSNELLKHSGIFSIAGQTLHKVNDQCKSAAAYTKKGSKASAYVSFDENKYFCFSGEVLDKCNGRSYDPKWQTCANNTLYSKCGNNWYEPATKYCSKNVIRDKELTDSRDGKKYKTAKIGSQTWMAENLDYHGQDGFLGLCKDKKAENCYKYGRFYDWAEAVGIDRKYNNEFLKDAKYWESNTAYQGICPAGWHLPHPADWQTLINFVGSKEAAEKKLMVESTDEQFLRKCKYITEDDRGRFIEHNNCPTDEYGFSGTDSDSWWNAQESFEIIAPDTAVKRAYAYSPWALGISPKAEIRQVRCLQTPTESQILAEAEAKEKVEKEAAEAKTKQAAGKEAEMQFGIRLAYNASTTYYNKTNGELGHGAEAGIVVNIPISDSPFEFSIGLNGIYRKPDNKDTTEKEFMQATGVESDVNVRQELIEYVASVPVLLKYNASIFFLQLGAQADFPVKMDLKRTKLENGEESWTECSERNTYDLGLVLGFGFHLGKSVAIDARAVGGASEFYKGASGYKLIQGSAGLSYLF